MRNSRRIGRRGLALVGFALAAGLARPALAQAWPARPLRWIVPFPPGGASDFIARLVAAGLQGRLGQPVTVENRSGATTIIGAEMVMRSPPDGYTMMTATIATLVFNAGVFTRLPYDPLKDFTHVAGLGVLPHIVAVHAGLPVRSMTELVALAQARPGQLNFASPGIASPAHFAIERFQRATGTRVTHVPYRGGAHLTTDLVSGAADATITDLTSLATPIRAGQIRAIAATQATRIEGYEQIPTTAEAGFPGLQIYSWQGVIMPAGVPDGVVARFADEVAVVLRTEDVRRRLRDMGVEVMIKGPSEFRDLVLQESESWLPLIRETGIKMDS